MVSSTLPWRWLVVHFMDDPVRGLAEDGAGHT